MARTRADALTEARRIVLGCVRRERETAATRRMTKRVAEIVLAYERSQTTELRMARVRQRRAPRFVPIVLASSLAFAVAVVWFVALATVRR